MADGETAALAKGGRTSFFGFLLRLLARIPFLFIAGRLYGAHALGRFAYATMVVEAMAALATLGLKRGLAAEMASDGRPQSHVVADALAVALAAAGAGALLLMLLPEIAFPEDHVTVFERWFPLIALAIVASDITLAALAFRRDIGATVAARSVVEPWVLSLAALALAFGAFKAEGLIIAYVLSLAAACVWSIWPAAKSFGVPNGWRPEPLRLARLARANLPLAGAELADWGSRRIDVFILGRFFGSEVIGIYYVAQQIATLPQKLKTSFDPILAPLLTTALAEGETAKAAAHVRQTGFWIGAAQLGVVLALGFTGRASMGLFGPAFAAGAAMMAMLLVAELLAAQAAVAESALIYVARLTNLGWSLAGIALQIAASLVLVPRYGGVGAAGALAIAALFLSVAKSRVLGDRLGHAVAGWRWQMAVAALPAAALGLAVLELPMHFEWLQLALGIPAILGLYAAIIWRIGFRGPDRLLFARTRAPLAGMQPAE